MAYAGDDYMRDGELVLANITEYRLTPELAVGPAGNIGQFNYKGNHVRTGEINAFSRWVPTQSMFKKTSPFGRCSGRDGHIRRKVKRQSLRTVIIHVQTRCRRK